jgi:hypothetical protein
VSCVPWCPTGRPSPAADTRLLQDDDEWDDYRENKKDFTGLKIEKLTVKEPEKEEEEETEVNEDGETVAKRKEGKDGPWNRADSHGERQGSVEEITPVQEEKREAAVLHEQVASSPSSDYCSQYSQ